MGKRMLDLVKEQAEKARKERKYKEYLQSQNNEDKFWEKANNKYKDKDVEDA